MNLAELREQMFEPCPVCTRVRAAIKDVVTMATVVAVDRRPTLIGRAATDKTWTTLIELSVNCATCRNRGAILTTDGRRLMETLRPVLTEAAEGL